MKLEEVLDRVVEGKATALSLSKELQDGKEALRVVLEQRVLQPELPPIPRKAESPARAHVFFEVKSFAAYLKKYGTADTVIYGDPENGVAHATLSEVSKDGFETLLFKPMVHPLWRPWEALCGRRLELAEFVDVVLNNRRSITEPDARDLVYSLSQIKASVKTEVQRGRGKNSVNGVVVTSTIQGEKKGELVELPESLTIETPLYIRTEKQAINLDLCIEPGAQPGEIFVSLSSGDILDAKVAAFDEMFQQLEKLSAEKQFTVTLGTPKHEAWAYLDRLPAQVMHVADSNKKVPF